MFRFCRSRSWRSQRLSGRCCCYWRLCRGLGLLGVVDDGDRIHLILLHERKPVASLHLEGTIFEPDDRAYDLGPVLQFDLVSSNGRNMK